MIHMPASLRPLARLSAPSRCWTRVAGLKRPLVQDRLSERCFRYYSAPSRQHFKIQGLQVPSDKLAEQLTTHTSPPFTTNTEAWEWIPPAKKSPLVTDDGFGGGDSAIEEVPNLRGEFLTVEEIVQVVKNNRGSDIEWVDLEGKTTAAKFMVIATAKSYRHVHKIAREILAEHKRRGVAVTRPREVSQVT